LLFAGISPVTFIHRQPGHERRHIAEMAE